jgi:hypothetical protein
MREFESTCQYPRFLVGPVKIDPHFCEDGQYMAKSRWAMRITMLGLLSLSAGTALAAATSDCGTLCGRRQLDAAASDPVEARLDAALDEYREARQRRPDENPHSLNAAAEAELRDSLGPISDRPDRDQLRNQLLAVLTPPETLQITLAGQEILIGADDRTPRRYSPGEPHARVDAFGTATIKTAFTPGKLTISERYDRKREYLETYAVLRTDGTLVVTRSITRPGLKPLLLRSVYRPG